MCTKVLAFTSIRSDYDLMSMLYKELHRDEDFEIKLIVSGAHLSESYGYTVKQIQEDGIPILAKVESLINSDSKSARVKSLSILLQNCIHSIVDYDPDIIIYAGDREDVIIGGIVGTYVGVPTIHFFGGDHACDGNIDNVIRHATSKLSTIHFVSNEEAKNRLINLGEEKERIFNVGSPSLDKFVLTPHMNKKDVLKKMDSEHWEEYCIVIYHPNTDEEKMAGIYFEEILQSLLNKNIKAFVSYPNVDSGNKNIISIIDKYKDNEHFIFYKNLPRDLFINLLRHSKFTIGNSSAGLYETPILKLAAINVGNRQKGRLCAENVVFVEQGKHNIITGIESVLSEEFQRKLKNIKSPYGDGKSVLKVMSILRTTNINDFIKKSNDPLQINRCNT